ncbi:MAG: TIGR03621 family F420-dependent LLM class oxidoreductase [Acidimicrobiales bacterium]
MPTVHPFQFSLQAFEATSAAAWVDTCRRAEASGYSTMFTTDHHFGPGEIATVSGHRPVDVAPISAMTMAAAVTTDLKVGCRVFCVDYHHPAVLAKELATVDFLSNGRLVAAIGAGWVKAEYDGLGIEQDRPGVRIARLAEAIDVLRAHWSGEPIDVQGRHVRVHGFVGTPSPVQRHIPLMVGGGAEKVLSLAGRVADIVSFNFNNASGKLGAPSVSTADEEQTLQKLQWVRDAAGDRFDEIELEIGAYFIAVTDDRDAAASAMAGRFGVSTADILAHPHALIGSVEQICETLEERRARLGISNICVAQRHLDEFAPVVARLAGR